MTYRLWGRPGWGSAIVEAQLAWYGLPFDYDAVDDLFQSAAARAALAPYVAVGACHPAHPAPFLVCVLLQLCGSRDHDGDHPRPGGAGGAPGGGVPA